jgi:hypothetical protein
LAPLTSAVPMATADSFAYTYALFASVSVPSIDDCAERTTVELADTVTFALAEAYRPNNM